jgi:mono/diheme cytochrome c family protein
MDMFTSRQRDGSLLGRLAVALAFAMPLVAADLRSEGSAPSVPQLFEKYCFDCHGDGMKKGKVALDELIKAGKSVENHGQWLTAWKLVRHEFMPPAGEETPTEAERKALADWMASERLGVDFTNPDPGRVTLRRLNRMEYDYSVQDLFGVNLSAHQDYSSDSAMATLQLRDRLPPDDTAFGFDNIGDFLSVSPALLEKFFDIAEYCRPSS